MVLSYRCVCIWCYRTLHIGYNAQTNRRLVIHIYNACVTVEFMLIDTELPLFHLPMHTCRPMYMYNIRAPHKDIGRPGPERLT